MLCCVVVGQLLATQQREVRDLFVSCAYRVLFAFSTILFQLLLLLLTRSSRTRARRIVPIRVVCCIGRGRVRSSVSAYALGDCVFSGCAYLGGREGFAIAGCGLFLGTVCAT